MDLCTATMTDEPLLWEYILFYTLLSLKDHLVENLMCEKTQEWNPPHSYSMSELTKAVTMQNNLLSLSTGEFSANIFLSPVVSASNWSARIKANNVGLDLNINIYTFCPDILGDHNGPLTFHLAQASSSYS